MDRSIYTAQWVEAGLDRDVNDIGEDEFQCEKHVYKEGAKRWFTLFHNSATPKFIDYFDRLIATEKRISLNLPQDIHDGSYSTAFASGITPQDLVMPLAPGVYLNNNLGQLVN